jgi:cell division protein FtsB
MNNEKTTLLTVHTVRVLDRVEFDTVSLNGFVLTQLLARITKLEEENAALRQQIATLDTSGSGTLASDVARIKDFLTNNFVNAINGTTF